MEVEERDEDRETWEKLPSNAEPKLCRGNRIEDADSSDTQRKPVTARS